MRAATLLLIAALAAAQPAFAQTAREIEQEYDIRLFAADSDSASVGDYLRAAEAARFMRRFDESRFYLDRAIFRADYEADKNDVLRERLWFTLATGGGVEEVQRIFDEDRAARDISPVVVAGWIYAFPELLVGGQYDQMLERMSGDAADADYRCPCYAPKAWMHRVAGRLEQSRAYWDSLTVSEDPPSFANTSDEADWRARLARNLVRAGRLEEGHAELERAMAVDVSAFESVSIRRRRAQTYAEHGEVDLAVADLEYLLSVPSPVTVHTLRARQTWADIREHPAFQALLAKHSSG